MKLLILTHRVPFPPNRGDRIRSFDLLRHLAARHEVHLACLADEAWTPETAVQLNSLCARVPIEGSPRFRRWIRAARSFAAGRSATEGLFRNPDLSRVVDVLAAVQTQPAAIAEVRYHPQ